MRLTIQPEGLSVGRSEKSIRPISVLSVLLTLNFYRLVVTVHTAYRSESACNLFGSQRKQKKCYKEHYSTGIDNIACSAGVGTKILNIVYSRCVLSHNLLTHCGL